MDWKRYGSWDLISWVFVSLFYQFVFVHNAQCHKFQRQVFVPFISLKNLMKFVWVHITLHAHYPFFYAYYQNEFVFTHILQNSLFLIMYAQTQTQKLKLNNKKTIYSSYLSVLIQFDRLNLWEPLGLKSYRQVHLVFIMATNISLCRFCFRMLFDWQQSAKIRKILVLKSCMWYSC